jgi:hypothetical protein
MFDSVLVQGESGVEGSSGRYESGGDGRAVQPVGLFVACGVLAGMFFGILWAIFDRLVKIHECLMQGNGKKRDDGVAIAAKAERLRR